MNSSFPYVRYVMDIKFGRGDGPSFLRMNGNVALKLSVQDSSYPFLWANDAPSLLPSNQRSRSLEQSVQYRNVEAYGAYNVSEDSAVAVNH